MLCVSFSSLALSLQCKHHNSLFSKNKSLSLRFTAPAPVSSWTRPTSAALQWKVRSSLQGLEYVPAIWSFIYYVLFFCSKERSFICALICFCMHVCRFFLYISTFCKLCSSLLLVRVREDTSLMSVHVELEPGGNYLSQHEDWKQLTEDRPNVTGLLLLLHKTDLDSLETKHLKTPFFLLRLQRI